MLWFPFHPFDILASGRRRLGRYAALLVLLLSTLGRTASALPPSPSPHLERFGVEDGLAHATVRAIHQDRRGFLWFGTESYLQRFDGYRFVAFKHDPEDPNTLSEGQVTAFAEDRAGNLWLGTRSSGVNRYDPILDRFERFPPGEGIPGRLSPGIVLALVEDLDGRLWVGTSNGLHRLDPATGHVERYPHREQGSGPSQDAILQLVLDRTGTLWVGTLAGLDRLDRERNRFEPVRRDPSDATSPGFDDFAAFLEDSRGERWVATWDGKLHRSPGEGRPFVTLDPEPDAAGAPGRGITTLVEDSAGDLWIGTHGRGMLRWRRQDGRFVRHAHHPADLHSLRSNKINAFVEDHSKVLWIATDSGLARLPAHHRRLTVLRHRPPIPGRADAGGRGLPGPDVMGLAGSRDGRLWIGTLTGGLVRYDQGEDRFDAPGELATASWSYGPVRALYEDPSGVLWIGSGAGLLRLEESGELRTVEAVSAPVNALLRDDAGALWVGTGGLGIFRLADPTNPAAPPLHLAHALGTPGGHAADRIYALVEDGPGRLWAASEGGLIEIDTVGGQRLEPRRHSPGAPGPSNDNIVALCRDRRGDLWLGSYGGGLDHWDRRRDRWQSFRERDGLASDEVVSILEDDEGILWLGTNGGLTRLDPSTSSMRTYDQADGLHGGIFFIGSALRSRGGELMFGGPGGASLFRPEDLADDREPPRTVITELRLLDQPVSPRHLDPGSPLLSTITHTDELVLGHRQKTLAFEIAGLHFTSPRRNRYAYRLDGYDEDWIEVDASHRTARYTNLDPGSYLFAAKTSNKDGVWSQPTQLRLTLRPHPLRTPWAYGIYTMAVLGLLLAAARFQHHRLLREQAINRRLREVDRLKDELIANTSHELRTPLMGITGIAEALIDGIRGDLPPRVLQDLALVVSSGRRLGSLVDDLLDFSKLEHRRLVLERHPVAVHRLVERVLSLCQPSLDGDSLRLINRVSPELPPIDGDENRLQQVLLNLVGNAIKFSREGEIEVSARQLGERIEISVRDEGPGIPPQHQERIFEAFQQADASIERTFGGAGLGLAVSRRLVELHGGRLAVESQPGRGARFFFDLPITEAGDRSPGQGETPPLTAASWLEAGRPPAPPLPAVRDGARIRSTATTSDGAASARDAPSGAAAEAKSIRILIVDDEEVNRKALESFLSHPEIETRLAANGPEALQLAAEERFDLVLLDIMMPRMSGYEVCRELRQQHGIEELPIVFLTAKGAGDDVVTGLSIGANDYLVKPVGRGELLARLRPHLDLLQIHRDRELLVSQRSTQIERLHGLLPICASCKKIRDDEGYWSEVETFILQHSAADLSHSLCPDCAHDHYGDYLKERRE